MAHALLALGMAHVGERDEAVAAGRRAVGLDPELAFAHYAHGWALFEHDDPKNAETAALEALRLDPGADGYALLAQIHVRQRQWQAAIHTAERGLQLDPEHGPCANLRAVALAHLGRTDEATAIVQDALELDPEDAYAHANRGWLLLRQSRPDDALESFRASLRLDPTLDWARLGIIEAMKARRGPYRLVLRYALWTAGLSTRARWLLILGLYFGARAARAVLRDNPALWPVLGPLLAAYVLFVFGSWIAHPISNLLLRLDPVGRLALNRVETTAANVVGACLAIAVAAGVMFAVTGATPLLILCIVAGFLLIPIGGAISGHGTRAWRPLLTMLVVLAAVGALAVILSFAGRENAGLVVGLFLVGAFLYGWLANYLVMKYS